MIWLLTAALVVGLVIALGRIRDLQIESQALREDLENLRGQIADIRWEMPVAEDIAAAAPPPEPEPVPSPVAVTPPPQPKPDAGTPPSTPLTP
jgi:outer membrane biosynthesis protein TonB